MSRYRLRPSAEQELLLLEHCAHARFVWNLAVEQQSWWRPGRGSAPSWAEQSRQLTEARAEFEWLRAGVRDVQEKALRDFDQAMQCFFNGTHGKPGWRKAGVSEGFRVSDKVRVRRLSRHVGEVAVPKVGWVRFRWSRAVLEAKSYRASMDPAGRWHVAFAAIPEPIPGPGTGEVVGVDRGVRIAAALSTGEMTSPAGLRPKEAERLLRLERKSARQRVRGRKASAGLKRTYRNIAITKAREVARRKDWAEKLSTDLARRFDVIRIEGLNVKAMTRSARGTVARPGRNIRQKAGLNRGILAAGWSIMAIRLEQKAPGRVEKVNPRFTSQRCSACGHVDRDSRESQARFRCTACGFTLNADANAAINIAAGHAVTARGDLVQSGRLVKREPLGSAA